jgi:hypothetical protein
MRHLITYVMRINRAMREFVQLGDPECARYM